MIDTNTIIIYLKTAVETKQPIAPTSWLDAAVKLNLLIGDEQKILFDLQQKVNQIKLENSMEEGKRNVSKGKIVAEASEEYRQMCMQKAKIEQIIEFIRLAKIQSKIGLEELRGY